MFPPRLRERLSATLLSCFAIANAAPDADRPPFVMEKGGVYGIPWGAGNYQWPKQMFWDSVPQIREKHYEMTLGADGLTNEGRVPVMSCVAWGYEYTAARGGDTALGFGDMSQQPGWGAWGRWIAPRADKYLARDWDGKILYPHGGYITPLMPLDTADWPPGIVDATYGDWAGWKLGTLANEVHIRGFYAADFVVGLYGGNHDFHPRVMDDFERWSGQPVPGTTISERASHIRTKRWASWNDFKAHRFARFYARTAEIIRSSGREPLVGGQILPHAASMRGLGNDFRIYLQHLPAKNWFFQVELQADEGRPVKDYWEAATDMGAHAARAPEFPFGAHMDAAQSNFWNSVRNNNRKDTAWGTAYLRHAWLSVGWTHHAMTDGSVSRSPRAFQRAYWDAGWIDSGLVALVRSRIPRHPFGPAFYYSTDLERQTEDTGLNNFWWWFEPKVSSWRLKGVPGGYFVSDSALANLRPENRPSGWFVYVDNLGKTHLKPEERARLEAIAPILTEAMVRDSCPLSFEGDSLGGYAFIDQKGSVIVVVSNVGESQVAGALRFAKVENGSYLVRELPAGRLSGLDISGNKGAFPLTLAGRETRVFEIEALRELGRKNLVPWTGAPYRALAPPGILRPAGDRLDALGRRSPDGAKLRWSAPPP